MTNTEAEALAFAAKLAQVDDSLSKWARLLVLNQGVSAPELKAMIREAMNVVEGKKVR